MENFYPLLIWVLANFALLEIRESKDPVMTKADINARVEILLYGGVFWFVLGIIFSLK